MQTFQIGDRVTYTIQEPAVARLAKANRTGSGMIIKIWLKFPASFRLAEVCYTIRFDRPLLGSHDWQVEARPGKRPAGLGLEEAR